MSKKYILGIDGGSQSTKIVIFDTDGNIICEGKESLKPMIYRKPGYVEHPDDDLYDSLKIASKKALSNFKGDLKDIIGVGLCTIRCCKAFLKADGSLAEPVMSWMDVRAYTPYVHENKEVKYITASTGYMTHRLTGEFKDTISNSIPFQFPTDIKTWNWDSNDEAFKKFNAPRDMFFELQMPGTILGYITKKASEETGIPEGIPVIATANDKAVEALGAGLIDHDTCLISLGTYIASMVLGSENTDDGKSYFTNFADIPNEYLYESSGIRRGMWTISWFRDLLGEEVINRAKENNMHPDQYLDNLAKDIPAGTYGLMVILDWLALTSEPYKRGVMIGFNEKHHAEHIFRAIIEGITLTMKNHASNMFNELGINPKRLIISGGGSNSPVFMKCMADAFGLPAYKNVVNGAASLGTAINVAVGLGVYSDYKEAVEKMVKIKEVIEPDMKNNDIYNRMNEVYKSIPSSIENVLKRSHKIFK